MNRSRSEHDQIFRSLTSRDLLGLQAALTTHLDHVRTHIKEGFKKMFVGRKELMVDLYTFQ